MTAKRFVCETLKAGDVSIDIMKDNGQIIEKFEAVNLLNIFYEENLKLKKVIEEDEKLIQSTYDELTKLRCIKKNLRRIKNQWDYIMEAIQYD